MRSIRNLSAPALLLTLVALVGCGGEDDGGDASTGQGKTVIAKVFEEPRKGIPADVGQWMVDIGVDPDGAPAFTVAKAIVPSGNANFRLKNSQDVGHDLTIEEVSVKADEEVAKTPVISEDSAWVRRFFFDGKRYVFYCSVPGHREAGMEGTIKVDPKLEAEDLRPF